ncbi:kinase-like domain-containing protein [Chiua virens]|nr:kinase-like domain-containing protein [Chiua virens]
MCINHVDGRYTLGEILGGGSHGIYYDMLMSVYPHCPIPFLATVYHAHDLISGQDITVKLKHCTQDPSSLEHKYHILKKLQGAIGFPQSIFFGRESSYCALVLNNVATSLCDVLILQGGHLNLDIVLAVGYQLVHRLKHLHSCNYIHHNIKLQNIMIQHNASNYTVFLINFGIASQYHNSATQAHIPYQQGCCFVGTPSFASINHHLGIQSSCSNNLKSPT